MRRSHWWSFLLFSTVFAGASAAQAVECTVSAGVPPIVRAEGLTEFAGDFIIDCVGGTPTATGQAVPQMNFTFTLTPAVPVTSHPTGQFNEALLIVDEPNTYNTASVPTLNCGATGAPDNGPSGPGVCGIISTGNPLNTYDGTANGYGAGATCDGSGHPAANTFQCGRPNIFQGRASGASAIEFRGVPFDPPGPSAHRIFRLTNVRLNASRLPASVDPFFLPTASIKLAISGPQAVIVYTSETQAASVFTGLVDPAQGAYREVALTSPILRREGFPSAWHTRNLSFSVGDNQGTLANGTYNDQQFPTYIYNGGTRYPADVAQNVPGAFYNTESGFLWQNNGPNRPPSPNPPLGFAANPLTSQSLGGPLSSASIGGVDTGVGTAGLAQFGTRLAIRLTNIPPGGSVVFPTTVSITKQGTTTNPTGVMALTTTDTAGAGPYAARNNGTFTSTDTLVVYEVLFADPYNLEDVNIPFTLNGFPEGTQLKAIISYAPFYSTTAAQFANASLPKPRFLDPCVSLPCLTSTPTWGQPGDLPNLAITANARLSTEAASQMLNGAQVKLIAQGQPDIVASSAILSGSTLTAALDLTGAPEGPRDVVVIAPSGAVNAIPNGFVVAQNASCTYTVLPQSTQYYWRGGAGSLAVSPLPLDCAWSASTTDSWITLGTKQGQVQSYTVAATASPDTRTGTITIAGQTIAVTQYGLNATVSYSPSVVFRGVDGDLWGIGQFGGSLTPANGAVASAPGSAMDSNGYTLAAARDQYNGIWVNLFGGYWAGWQFAGGVVQGVPAVAAASNGAFWIASRDQYDAYWLTSFTVGFPNGSFGPWTPLHGVFSTDPVVAGCPDGSIYIIGKDHYNALWSGHYIPGTGLQPFQLVGGVVQGSPSVTCGSDDAAYIGVRDFSNSNWIARVSGDTWTGWFNGGAVTSIDPRIVATTDGVSIVILDSGGAVWRGDFLKGSGNGWQSWTRIGGELVDVAPVFLNGYLTLFGKSPSQNLWRWYGDWSLIGHSELAAGPLSAAPR